MNSIYQKYTLPLALSLSVAMTGCGGGGGGDAGPGPGPTNIAAADMNGETFSHKSWDQLSPAAERSDTYDRTSDPFPEIVDIDEYSCTTDHYSLTDNPKEFVSIQPDSSVVWLGNLIQGQSHLRVGSLQELSIRERAQLGISIDFLTGDNYRLVDQPSLLSVNSAVGELIDSAMEAGHVASSDVYFESREAHSTSQASLDLGISAEYLGFRAESSLSVSKEANEHTFYAYFLQKAFTVSVELPTSPGDVVTDEFTEDKLQKLKGEGDIGEDNPPLYISNMSYGRVLIYKMTSTYSAERIQAAIEASYRGLVDANGNVDTEAEDTLATAKIEIAAFGGDESNIEALIRTGELGSYFSGDTKLSSMRPISFEVRRLADNEKADIVRTTEYAVKKCDYVGKTVPPVGEVVKVLFDRVRVPADCDGGIDPGDIYGRFDVIYKDRNTGGNVTRRVVTIGHKGSTKKVASGNSFNLGIYQTGNTTFSRYYGDTFRISGQLMDADSGANGADDLVGNWNANQQDISRLKPGTHTRKAVSNCSGSTYNPTLTFRLERVDYIY